MKRKGKQSDKQRKAMFANMRSRGVDMGKTPEGMNADLNQSANVFPNTPANVKIWEKPGGSRRMDIEGIDTKPKVQSVPPRSKPVPAVEATSEPAKEEKKIAMDIDEFYKNYPVDKVEIPFDYNSIDVDVARELQQYGGTEISVSDIQEQYGNQYTTAGIKKSLDALENRGYATSNGEGKHVSYSLVKGGYAKLLADKKGEYADFLYGKEKINKYAAKQDANAVREKSIEGLKRTVLYNDNEYKATLERHKEVKAMADARGDGRGYATDYLLKNAKKYKKASDDARAGIVALEKDEVVLHGGTKKLQKDVAFVMKEYFDIDPATLKNNKLNLGYSKMGGAGGYLQTSGTMTHREYTLRVDDVRYRKGDVESNGRYVDVLIHELTHWLRKVDAQRAYATPTMNDMGKRSKDTDTEEKETVMEVGARIGKMAPSGKKGYYHYLKSGVEDAGQYDNKILTISPKQTSDKSLSQVGENLELRKNATLISRLELRGRSEWVDMFYEAGNSTSYQVYNPEIPKNFNPRNIAKQIDMQDGIRGNENIHEWRDGKKHLVIKKET